ncbi:MAG: AAA family ATPase [Oscillospiraceae bacterium]
MQEITEPYYQLYLNSKNFIDMTDFLEHIIRIGGTVLGEHQCGKSTLCSMVRCCLDEKLSYAEMFGKEAAATLREKIREDLNSFPVISIDFSDFAAENYDDAISYLRRKMADLYFSYKDYLLNPENEYLSSRDDSLSIMDESADMNRLAYSLRELVQALNCSKPNKPFERETVLILDESNRMNIVSNHFGYGKEMNEFIDEFLRIEPYDDLFTLLETGYKPYNSSVYGMHHCAHQYTVSRIDCLRKVCELNNIPVADSECCTDDGYSFSRYSHICSIEQAYSLMPPAKSNPSQQKPDETRLQYLKEMRRIIDDELEQERLKKEAEKERIRKRYKMNLPEHVHIPSRNAGIRDYLINPNNAAYLEREQLLRELFIKFGNKVSHSDLFQEMHGVDDAVKSDWNDENYNLLKRELKEHSNHWKRLDIDKNNPHWCFVNGTPKNEADEIFCLQYIKMYISVPDDVHISKLFTDAVRVLASQGVNSFTAKVSKFKRHDAICIWVSRHDFFLMEQFFKSRQNEICRKLPFIAYRGNIGIGREMASWDSQSGIQCRLFATYFSMKERPEDIFIREMYSLYVQGWNSDLPDNHPMTKEFKSENAQSMLVLLDSLDVNLEITELNNQHILLQDDKKIWNPLCDGYCWADVGEQYLQENS